MADTTGAARAPQPGRDGEQPEAVATALKTHRYLRLSFIFAVAALFIGVALASVVDGELVVRSSISSYYWTPARNVFVGVLIAASLAMIALNGRGGAVHLPLGKRRTLKLPSPSILLDFAAIFGPLIAIVPTDLKANEQGLTTFTCEPNEKECLPIDALPDVRNGVLTYVVIVAVILGFMWFVRGKKEDRKPFARFVPVTGIVTAVLLLIATFGLEDTFPYVRFGPASFSIHYIATLLFFAAFATVVWIRGAREEDPEDRTKATDNQKRWYRRLATAMAVVIVFLVALSVVALFGVEDLFPGFPEVLVGEFAGLILFAWFWGIQTKQRWNEYITPLPTNGKDQARRLSEHLTAAQ